LRNKIAVYRRQNIISLNEFKNMQKILSANFNINYSDINTLDYQKCKMLYGNLLSKGCTKNELYTALQEFIENEQYPNWTLAGFLKYVKFTDVPEIKNIPDYS